MPDLELQDMSQGEAAYARLYAAIRAGEFKPGDRLRETEVAAKLSLSRTPVREALRKLESDGIVEHRPSFRGCHPHLVAARSGRAIRDAAGLGAHCGADGRQTCQRG